MTRVGSQRHGQKKKFIISATCFGSICRAILRLIFEQAECTIDNEKSGFRKTATAVARPEK